ncbi:mannosyl-glycoprotein endo-beta-N-acetylglucosamidase [Paraburkholderia sp. Ac-20340]|uniref:glycoside hydrolase family 73 protein n=1 Tax=Paraburkholderia sp. Ac-20340 TaxID=2703888 RepID=UPI00197F854F|nr:glucosaminidase domain-containing protein [Paraburkholderia sp. Ac-20340]MBN3852024.1 mannosyl-glycoprotein endo-beta-N-acetylglucosamidase [Paraburkholderia sp. Ac-20340]
MTPNAFIAAIAPAARALALTTKIPASFTTAQAALESGWATSQLAQRYFNLFGVKADSSWKGPVVVLPTYEFVAGQRITVPARWRVYADWLGSLKDHASFLIVNPRYAAAFSCTNGAAFAQAVAAAGYATDPTYASKIISIINAHSLTQLDA